MGTPVRPGLHRVRGGGHGANPPRPGRDYLEYAKLIGEAAQRLLQDPRVKEAQYGENHHWLALLAHEFATLTPAELREVLTKGKWVSWNCARALLRGSLPTDQLAAVFEDYASHLGPYQDELAWRIICWISSLQPGPVADAVRQAAEHALGVLVQQGRGQNAAHFPPYAYLLFPITVWVFGGKASKESIDLYWYGIRLVFSVISGEIGIKRSVAVLQVFEPLMVKVPQTVWASVREAGVTSDDPSVRSLVGMLGGFVGTLPQAVAPFNLIASLCQEEPHSSEEE